MADSAFVVVPPLAALVFKAAGRHPVAGDDDPLRTGAHLTICGVSGGVHHSPLLALTAPRMWMIVATTMTSG